MSTDPHYRKLLNEDDSGKKALKRSGYASGGGIDAGDRKAVHKHEKHLHAGQPETKLAHGGPAKRGGGSRTKVIVNAEGDPGAKQAAMQQGLQAGRQQGMQQGVQAGARMAAQQRMGGGAPPAPRPPMAPPPGAGPGGPPPAGIPPAASMGAKRGGKVAKRK